MAEFANQVLLYIGMNLLLHILQYFNHLILLCIVNNSSWPRTIAYNIDVVPVNMFMIFMYSGLYSCTDMSYSFPRQNYHTITTTTFPNVIDA